MISKNKTCFISLILLLTVWSFNNCFYKILSSDVIFWSIIFALNTEDPNKPQSVSSLIIFINFFNATVVTNLSIVHNNNNKCRIIIKI